MNVKPKQILGYILIAILFTFVGYIIALLVIMPNLTVKDAQAQNKNSVIDYITCKGITIVNEDGEPVILIGTDQTGTALMEFNNNIGENVLDIGIGKGGSGGVSIANNTSTIVASIGVDEDGAGGGVIFLTNKYGKSPKKIDFVRSKTATAAKPPK